MLENASNYFYNIGFKKVTRTIVSTVTYIKDYKLTHPKLYHIPKYKIVTSVLKYLI